MLSSLIAATSDSIEHSWCIVWVWKFWWTHDLRDCDVEHHAPLLDISPLAGLGSLRNLTLRAWETSCAQGIMRNPARLHGLHKVLCGKTCILSLESILAILHLYVS